jgi:hypothetical protein
MTYANQCIIAFDTLGDTPCIYNPDTISTEFRRLRGLPPDFSIMREHQGRLWTNDKTNPDRLHYSSPGNYEEWNGEGDSGAIDIGTSDGDFKGITAIFPTFKGDLFVAKGNRTYRVIGNAPENYRVESVSDGLGCVGHNTVAPVDLDDMLYISYKGIHALSTTDAYGDFEGKFLSQKIQPTFDTFSVGSLPLAHAAYIPSLNSVAFALTAASGQTSNQDIYLFNVPFQSWYLWPNQPCDSLTTQKIGNVDILMIGRNDGRIARAQTGDYTDFDTAGIIYKLKTGTIYPENNVDSIKGFKKISLLFRPKGNYSFQLGYKIDNLPRQVVGFQQTMSGDRLGVDFFLGTSILGFSNELAPFTASIDGYGRGIILDITQTGSEEQVEIYGFIIEYEDAGDAQEVVVTQNL